MRILKYLIKPMKLILLLCMFSAVIYYRSIIFHANVNQYIDMALAYAEQQLDIVIPQHLSKVETVYAAAPVPATDCIKPPETASEMAENEDSQSDADQEIVVIDQTSDTAEIKELAESSAPQADENSPLIAGLYETVNVINEKVDMLFERSKTQPVAEPPLNVPAAQDDVNESVEKTSAPVSNAPVNNVSSDFASSDTKKMLFMARQSFWNGNAQASEKLYLDLVGLEDGDPDIYGELGNVYYAQGKWKQAGKAYYEAAVRLLALKQDSQVSYLLRVIQGLDMESADKLRHKISG
ncbi:MAG: hypothetical protein OQK72_13040 [Gammaproteobacteria bacterium]|nr:hypothetical protein [Gammaproteobacteria bacterium]MCW9056064.1 hypothetical protein [Gammaproteobacteria bacterium]